MENAYRKQVRLLKKGCRSLSSLKHASLTELFLYFFKLSWTAFGGPLAYISMMEDDCVEKRKWIGKEEFAEMLGVTNMLPGPNAAEMAIHIGYVKGGCWRNIKRFRLRHTILYYNTFSQLALLPISYGASCRRHISWHKPCCCSHSFGYSLQAWAFIVDALRG